MRKHARFIIVMALGLLWCLPGVLCPRGFWVADETRYAEVLRGMLEEGHWLVPHLNGFFYPDKPPLFFWLCAGVSRLGGGISLHACMLVTLVTALGALAVCYLFARDLFGERVAFASALAMMSSLLFLTCAQIVRMDMMMTLFVSLAIYSFHRGWRSGSRAAYALSHFFSGMAILSKGPLGFLFSFLPPVAFLLQGKHWRDLRSFLFPPFLLIPLVVGGGWLGVAWMAGHHDFVRSIFIDQLAGRAVGGDAIHSEPFYFYLLLLPLVLLPWSPFLPRAVRHASACRDDGLRLLFWWFATGLVVISLISGKLFIYLLPILPPVAMLTGIFIVQLLTGQVGAGKAFRVEAVLAALLAFGVPIAAPFAARFASPAIPLHVGWMAGVFLPVLVVALVWAVRCRVRAFALFLLAGYWLFSASIFLYAAPQVDALYSGREISAEIARHAAAGRRVATMGLMRGILNFYAGTTTRERTQHELPDFLRDEDAVLVMRKKHLERNREAIEAAGAEVLAAYPVANHTYLVVGHPQAP